MPSPLSPAILNDHLLEKVKFYVLSVFYAVPHYHNRKR